VRKLKLRLRHFAIGAAGCALLAACATAGSNPGTAEQTIVVNGVVRHYDLHLPKSYRYRRGPMPLVVVLHGHGSSGVKIERATGMSDKADKEAFIAAYPDGRGDPRGWQVFDDPAGNNEDVAFIRQLIDTLEKLYAVDPKRVFVAGHSNGGMMAYRLGAALPDKIAGIGVSAALLGKKFAEDATPTPVTLVAIHGKADNVVPYDGSDGDFPYHSAFLSAPASVEAFARRNGCDSAIEKTRAGGNVVEKTYSGCDNGSAVVFVTVNDLTHKWSGDRHGFGKIIDRGDVIATNEMWSVFKDHPKP
jgi:polyhydroxybutyrate depolymerase